jgi:hypothetical protein
MSSRLLRGADILLALLGNDQVNSKETQRRIDVLSLGGGSFSVFKGTSLTLTLDVLCSR